MGLLSVKGSGKDRKVAYDKAKAASMKKGGGTAGGSSQPRRDFSATREQRIAAGLSKAIPVGGGKELSADALRKSFQAAQGRQTFEGRTKSVLRAAQLINTPGEQLGGGGPGERLGLALARKVVPERTTRAPSRIESLRRTIKQQQREIYARTSNPPADRKRRYGQLKERERRLGKLEDLINKGAFQTLDTALYTERSNRRTKADQRRKAGG